MATIGDMLNAGRTAADAIPLAAGQVYGQPPLPFLSTDTTVPLARMRSSAVGPRQASSLRGAQTEVARGERMAAISPPFGEILQEEQRREGPQFGALTPAFDLLNAGLYTTAGFFSEAQRTGQFGSALKQAGIEFYNAMPFLEDVRARRTTFSDILDDNFGAATDTPGRWGRAALGFVLDVAFDPLTYLGGVLFKPLTSAVRATQPAVRGLSFLESAGAPLAGGLGEKFIPHFRLRQMGLSSKEAKGGVEQYLDITREHQAMEQGGMVEMRDAIAAMMSEVGPVESRIITRWFDQGDEAVEKHLKSFFQESNIAADSDIAQSTFAKVREARHALDEYWEKEVAEGLLSPGQLRTHYLPHRNPTTRRSEREWAAYAREEGIEQAAPHTSVPSGGMTFLGNVKSPFQKSRSYPTLNDRMLAGEPTEIDFSKIMLTRGMEHTRAVSTRRFVKAVLEDSEIVKKVDGPQAKALLKDKAELKRLDDAGYTVFDGANFTDISKEEILGMGGQDLFRILHVDKPGAFVMPKVIAKDLVRAHKVVSDVGEATKFWHSFQKMQGVWKAYALLSTGYHMRNMYSNFFQNWLAGVSDPRRYMSAMALQAGGTENLPFLVRQAVEGAIGGRKTLDDIWTVTKDGTKMTGHDLKASIKEFNVTNTGVFAKDMALDFEREMLTSLEGKVRKSKVSQLTVGAQTLKQQLKDTGTHSEVEADTIVRLTDARAHTWGWQQGRNAEEWYSQRIAGVQRLNSPDELDEGLATYYQRADKGTLERFDPPEVDEPILPHGDVEKELSAIYRKARSQGRDPLPEELRHILGGARDRQGKAIPINVAELKGYVDYAIKNSSGAHRWYVEFGQDMRDAVGEENMAEMASVWSILSRQNNPEDNLADAFLVMRLARRYISKNEDAFDEVAFRQALTSKQPKEGTLIEVKVPKEKSVAAKDLAKWDETPGFRRSLLDRPRRPGEAVYRGSGKRVGRLPEHMRGQTNPGKDVIKIDDQGNFYETTKGPKITGAQVNDLTALYKASVFQGDLKTQAFTMTSANRHKMGFFPFVVNDVHMARPFGYGSWKQAKVDDKKLGRNKGDWYLDPKYGSGQHKEYRVTQYITAQIARDMNMSPDEVQAALWYYSREIMSPKPESDMYSHVGGLGWKGAVGAAGSSKSAFHYAGPGYKQLEEVLDKTKGLPGFEKYSTGYDKTNYPMNQSFPRALNSIMLGEERIIPLSSKVGHVATGTPQGSFAQPGATWEELEEFHETLFSRLVIPGQPDKLKVLSDPAHGVGGKSLEEILGFKHSVRPDGLGTFGEIEPNYSIVLETQDDRVASAVASILADGLQQDAAVWYSARRYTKVEIDQLASRGLEPAGGVRLIKDQEEAWSLADARALAKELQEDGIDFTLEPGNRALRILNFSDDTNEVYFARVKKHVEATEKKLGIKTHGESFFHQGGYIVGKEKYAEAISGLRMDLAGGGQGASDLPGRIYSALHEPFNKTYGEFAERHSTWRRLGAEAQQDRKVKNASTVSQGIDRVHKQGDLFRPAERNIAPGLEPATILEKHRAPGLTLYQEGARGVKKGALQMQEDGRAMISLFEGADVSTTVHELAHIMRMRDLEGDDLATIERWVKVADGAWDEAAEEKFARGFERYLHEGNAPTAALSGVFDRMKDWMQNIYHTLRGSPLKHRINSDVRGVFDRLLGKGTADVDEEGLRGIQVLSELKPELGSVGEVKDAMGDFIERWAGTSSPQVRGSRVIGSAIENNAKIAHFIDKIESTGNANVAAASVRKYLFDYTELTEWERDVARSLMPFYTWMRKNVPLQFQAIAEDPGKYAKVPKLMDAIEKITPDWQGIETPDYFHELHAVRLPLLIDSQPIYANPNMPFQDLNRLNAKDIVGGLTPFLKILGEWFPARGYNFFQDRPTAAYEGQPGDFLPGIEKKTESVIQSLVPPLGKVARAAKAGGYGQGEGVKGGKLALQVVSEVLGIKGMPVDVLGAVRGSVYAQREALRRAKRKAADLGIELPSTEQTGRGRRRSRRRRHRPRGSQ